MALMIAAHAKEHCSSEKETPLLASGRAQSVMIVAGVIAASGILGAIGCVMRPGFGLLLLSIALIIDISLPSALMCLSFITTCLHPEFFSVSLILAISCFRAKTAPFLCAGLTSLLCHV